MSRILSRILCFLGCYDWRHIDGKCCECGKIDVLKKALIEKHSQGPSI